MRNPIRSAGPGALALLMLGTASAASGQPDARFKFNLPAEGLSQALRDVAVKTGRNLIAPGDLLQSRNAPALSGNFTAEEAVSRLLEGTGLRYRLVERTLVIERQIPGTIAVADGAAGQEIVVTGTHIRGGPPTSPVLTITRRDIDEAAATSVEDLMRRLPQNLSAGVAQENFAVNGAGADITEHGAGIDLRGLGQRATLVLVNGQRIAPSGTGSFVDVSLIPVSAVERVEILTDGASAIYGSDAVAGVVNLILRKDFRGLETTVQAGTTTRGGGDQLLAGATAGTGWTGGGAMLSYEYRDEQEIRAGDRDFTIGLPAQWSLFPREHRHSLYGVARQQLGSNASLEVTGSYAARNSDRSYFIAGPLVPVDAHAEARSLGGNATLDVELGRTWRADATISYFRSRTREEQNQPAGEGLVNIFNTMNSVAELELKADGTLFGLPGGGVKLAVGAQGRSERFTSLFKTQVNLPTPQAGRRDVGALYAELVAPLFGAANRRPGFEQLVLSAAGRYERYQHLGSSFDPKVGLLWSPLDGLRFRASYGTSFRAPLLSETLGLYNAFLFPASFLYIDRSQAPAGVGAVVIGSNPNVRPETSRSFSAGGEWSNPLPGLNLRATYYSIRFSNRIALPTQQIVVVGDPALEPIVTRNPAAGFVSSLLAGAGQVLDFSGPGFTNGGARPQDVVVLVDARVANTAESRTSGLDFGLDYSFRLAASRYRVDVNATRIFRFDDRLTSASPVIHTLDTPYHPVGWRARAGLSWALGPVSAVLFGNYTGSYRDNRGGTSAKVSSFTTLDAGIAYESPHSSAALLRGLRLSLNVENLFDTVPPRLAPDPGSSQGIGYDPVNATGRGRAVSVGLRKAW